MFDHDSKIFCYVHKDNHEMDFESVSVVAPEGNSHEQLFLEAWFSRRNFPHAGSTCCFLSHAF